MSLSYSSRQQRENLEINKIKKKKKPKTLKQKDMDRNCNEFTRN